MLRFQIDRAAERQTQLKPHFTQTRFARLSGVFSAETAKKLPRYCLELSPNIVLSVLRG
jgi:hypothetical protein